MRSSSDKAGRSEASGASVICHRCACMLTPGEGSFYVVLIEAIADPAPPRLDGETPASAPTADELIEQMKGMSERELMDQVHRRMTIHLCTTCYRQWIENPTGESAHDRRGS